MSSTSNKGAIAETAIAAAAVKAGITVLRPLAEGRRYDLVFDTGEVFLRVQCKWGRRRGDVIGANLATCRLTPRGYVRTTYNAADIDGIAIYCPETDKCYWLPLETIRGQYFVHLRLAAAANNQRAAIHSAADHEFPGAIAQLGERRRGTPEVGGSSPPSSIAQHDDSAACETIGAHEFRERFAGTSSAPHAEPGS
jgi:hypothetical protein